MHFISLILLAIASCYATKTVKANDIIKKLEKGESIEIADAVVEGVLDFSSVGKPSPVNSAMFEARVRGNVFFYKCAFKDAVIAQKNNVRTRFDGNLVFLESEFQKEANFSDAAVFGTVNFSKSIFKESADFNQMAMWSKSIYFSEIAASKKFSLEGSSLHGALSIMNSKFLGKFSLQEVFIQGNLQASNASFDGSTDFAMLKVGNRAIFRYATFKHKPDFGASKFAEAPEM